MLNSDGRNLVAFEVATHRSRLSTIMFNRECELKCAIRKARRFEVVRSRI